MTIHAYNLKLTNTTQQYYFLLLENLKNNNNPQEKNSILFKSLTRTLSLSLSYFSLLHIVSHRIASRRIVFISLCFELFIMFLLFS